MSWQQLLPYALPIVGAILTFAWKEPKTYIRLQKGIHIAVNAIYSLAIAFLMGAQYAASAARIKAVEVDIAQRDVANAVASAAVLTENAFPLILGTWFVTTAVLFSGWYLAEQILKDRSEEKKPTDKSE